MSDFFATLANIGVVKVFGTLLITVLFILAVVKGRTSKAPKAPKVPKAAQETEGGNAE
jgi:hypothetical protein